MFVCKNIASIILLLCIICAPVPKKVAAEFIELDLKTKFDLVDAATAQNSFAKTRPEMIAYRDDNHFANFTSNRIRNFVTYCKKKYQPRFLVFRGSLLTYMMRLAICKYAANKSWLEDECQHLTYAYTDYHKAVYLKFCNSNKFRSQCKINLDQNQALYYWLSKYNVTNTIEALGSVGMVPIHDFFESSQTILPTIHSSYCKAIKSFLHSIVLQRYSVNSAGYLSENLTRELEMPLYNIQYSEWFIPSIPFCRPSACGISRKDYDNHSITAYECLPSNCKVSMIATIVIDAMLSVLIVIANFLVLAVAWRTTVMHNIPGYFKTSLAIADLIVGLVVLPGSIYHNVVLNLKALLFKEEAKILLSTDFFDQSYLNFMGIFTVLSFSISVYMLAAASIAHYLAVTKPIKYRQGKYLTRRRALTILVILWIFGFGISLYPIFTTRPYQISAVGLVLSSGFVELFLYAIGLGLPLLLVWTINLGLIRHVWSERNKRKKLFAGKSKSNQQKSQHSVAAMNLKELSSRLDVAVSEDIANLRKVMIYLLTSCNTEERIAQNIYIHNSNRSIKKKINYKNNFNQETDRHRL